MEEIGIVLENKGRKPWSKIECYPSLCRNMKTECQLAGNTHESKEWKSA